MITDTNGDTITVTAVPALSIVFWEARAPDEEREELLQLTPAEARQLAKELTEAADRVEKENDNA